MSQEIPQIQEQSMGTTQQPTQLGGGQQMGTGQPQGTRFEDKLNNEMRVALHDFVEAATTCDWCADECLGDPQMEECARLCRDVADLAALNIQFMSRDSAFGPDLAETFAHAAEQCRQECARHQQEHCQECAAVLGRAVDSTWEMLGSFQRTGRVQTAQF